MNKGKLFISTGCILLTEREMIGQINIWFANNLLSEIGTRERI